MTALQIFNYKNIIRTLKIILRKNNTTDWRWGIQEAFDPHISNMLISNDGAIWSHL